MKKNVIVYLVQGTSSRQEIRFSVGSEKSVIQVGSSELCTWHVEGKNIAEIHFILCWNGDSLSVVEAAGAMIKIEEHRNIAGLKQLGQGTLSFGEGKMMVRHEEPTVTLDERQIVKESSDMSKTVFDPSVQFERPRVSENKAKHLHPLATTRLARKNEDIPVFLKKTSKENWMGNLRMFLNKQPVTKICIGGVVFVCFLTAGVVIASESKQDTNVFPNETLNDVITEKAEPVVSPKMDALVSSNVSVEKKSPPIEQNERVVPVVNDMELKKAADAVIHGEWNEATVLYRNLAERDPFYEKFATLAQRYELEGAGHEMP